MTHKLPPTSVDVTADRLEALRALFPEAFAEGRVDFDKLRLVLGDAVDAGRERYGLAWAGKAEAVRAVQIPSVGTLVPDRDASVDFDTTANVLIEGDNLEVLKLLQRAYHGKVRLIYIDPPYNTGKEFIYPDNFREGLDDYLRYSGQVDGDGFKVSTNTEADGRYHSKWLSMMYPRLFLARNLLRDDGLIAISIDDNEHHDLRLVLDEVFGAENFVTTLVWQKAYVANMTAKFVSTTHDYLVVYARSVDHTYVGRIARTDEQIAKFENPDGDARGPWKAENLSAGKYYSAGQFTIVTPSGREAEPPPGRYWRCNRETYERWVSEGRIWFGKDGDGRPMLKKYLSEVRDGLTPDTWWRHEDAGTNKEATIELKRLFGGEQLFDTPKPARLLKRLLNLFGEDDSLVMDFFAGSGTTGDAVMQLNADDGGNRRYILVQLPEPTGRDDYPTIADITKARLRAAGDAIRKEREGKLDLDGKGAPDLGFRVFKLTASNFRVWDGTQAEAEGLAKNLELFADNLKAGRDEEAVLFEIMIRAGIPLTAPMERRTLGGQTVSAYRIGDGDLLVCLAQPVTRECLRAMIAEKPQMVVCLDRAFEGNDELLTNIVLEMQSHRITFRTV